MGKAEAGVVSYPSVPAYLKESFFIIKVYFPEILILIHLSQKMTFLFAVSVLPKYLKIFLVSLLGFFKDFDYPYIVLYLSSTYLCFRLYSFFCLHPLTKFANKHTF